jgi:hypothetical protein
MATVAGDRNPATGSATWPFVATIFVGSFLLFLVQPMVARMALPRLGGAPSVWNSAMLVYQALLLAGYAYAHWLGRLALRHQAAVHLVLFALAALALPIGLIAAEPSPGFNPFLWVPWLLVVSIGPLFFVVSAQAPLIQRWYSHAGTRDPYPLYAASNFGSFAGLLAYPLVVEPLLPIHDQRWLWSAAYVLLALLVGWCALKLPKHDAAPRAAVADTPAPGWRERATWIILAAVPSGLILSTTLHITTDLVAMPLLWVLPLGAYLLSFTIAFAARRGPAEAIAKLAPLVLVLSGFAVYFNESWLALLFSAVAITNLLTVGVSLHSRLFDSRPDAAHLTLFYLMLSIGGVLGGIFCALIAPLIFDWTYEHLLLLVAAAWLMRGRNPFARFVTLWDGDPLARKLTVAGIVVLAILAIGAKDLFGLVDPWQATRYCVLAIVAIAILAIGNRLLFTCAVAAFVIAAGGRDQLELSASPGKLTRSFFGIYSVRTGHDTRTLVHGTTMHGVQNLGSPERERMPTTYYARPSGVGFAMQAAPALFGSGARIDVVGLGSGTLACYARPGEHWTFYEIDPAVVGIARNPRQFTFLSRCLPQVPIVIGDARLTLARAPAGGADLLVVDAFSSDAIPIHLMTREAFAVYGRRLAPNGLLMIHISNRFLDLQPVVAADAAAEGWQAMERWYTPSAEAFALHESQSQWIALSRSPETLKRLTTDYPGWRPLEARPGFAAWSDDHASVLPLFRLGP